jgi:diguanylate cyclase (GGDEF)-like protein
VQVGTGTTAVVTGGKPIAWPGRFRAVLASRSAAASLNALVLIVLGVAACLMIWHGRQSAFDDHERGLDSMGVVLAEQTGRYVQVVDLIVQEVRSKALALDIKTLEEFQRLMGTQAINAFLIERLQNVPQADAVALIGADGIVVNWSRPHLPDRMDVSGRDYFIWFRDHDDRGIFIGELAKGYATGDPNVYFARRVNEPGGRFLGVILGVVNVKYLSDFYQAATEHVGMSVRLARRDGAILIRYPNTAVTYGAKLPAVSPWYRHVSDGGGNYVAPSLVEGVRSLVSVHPLHDYPLVVDILQRESLVFAQWRTEAFYIASIALTVALSFSGLIWVVARQIRLQEEQNSKLEDTAGMLRAYAEMSADWFWEQDADFRFRFDSNIPFMVATNDTGKTRRDLADPAMNEERWVKHYADLTAHVPFRDFRWERIGADGERHFMSTNGDPVFDRNGVFSGYRGTGRDITLEVRASARLAQANVDLELGRQQIEAVLTNITHGICLFDNEERLLVWNRRWTELYDLPAEAAYAGCSLAEIAELREAAGSATVLSPSDYEAWRDEIRATTDASSRVVTLKNGRAVAIHVQPLSNGGWVASHEDVTKRQQTESSIAFMAQHDSLTRLANRMLFHDRLEQAIHMVGRGHEFAVICLDLDRFKAVNDTLGHPVGDGLLRAVADRMSACARHGDTVARLGGDEFAIIQLDVGQPEHAQMLASRIIDAFRDPFDIDGHRIDIGTSIGVAVAPSDGCSSETLLKNADIALYHAKTEGRGGVRFFEPEMDARIQIRRTLETDLRSAVLRGEFELYYQPLINLIAGEITGFEALLRWNRPGYGVMSPAEFIPVAEEMGIIVEIGEWALRSACFEAENWPVNISVAVNLSPVQFEKGDIVASVRAALAASGLRPDRLELEVTESVLLRETAGTLTVLHQLRAMGITVALDDFGTGYSSLSYLRSFPFDKIKIDQSFVRDLVTNNESMSIIRAVTGLGQSMNIKTTAEGVETQEQLNMLREHGCTEAQGFLFNRPAPANELRMLIERLKQTNEFEPGLYRGSDARSMNAFTKAN